MTKSFNENSVFYLPRFGEIKNSGQLSMNNQIPSSSSQNSLRWLLLITYLNYLAQIPYYFHYYFSSAHPLPAVRASLLLGFTLIWFLAGVFGYQRGKSWGFGVLISYLFIEALFYLLTIASGTFLTQVRNHPLIIDVVFVIGYISGLTATYYLVRIIRFQRSATH